VWLLLIETTLIGNAPSAGKFAPGASAGALAGAIQTQAATNLLAPALGALLLIAYAGVLAAADPRVAPVLTRVTRDRLTYMERLYTDLGLTPDQATRQARLAYALYLGISELRRADPDHEPTDGALNAYLDMAVNVMMPSDRAPDLGADPERAQRAGFVNALTA